MKKAEIRFTDKNSFRISPLLFGSFIEHIENCIAGGIYDSGSPLSDWNGIRIDVLKKCAELSPTCLRFPGGTVIGIYHWEDHVGPIDKRKKKKNIVWGGMLTHEFGTCEYIEFCREIGAEPIICVNMATGTAEEAADWVEYCNGTGDTYFANLRRSHGYEEPFNVKYWCIGNESYAVPDLGTQHDVNVYIRDAWEFTKYMKMTDPGISLIFVGYDDKWNRAVLDSLGDVCDFLSLHFYAGGEHPLDMTESFVNNTLKPAIELIKEYNSSELTLDRWYRIPPRKDNIKLAIDEWNIWNPKADSFSPYGLRQIYTWKDAIWTADFLMTLIEHSEYIGIANLAQLVNVIAPIMAEKAGSWKQCTFYPFELIRKNCGKSFIPSECTSDEIRCIVTETDSRHAAFIINLSKEIHELGLPFNPDKQIILYAKKAYSFNSMDTDCVIREESSPQASKVIIKPYSINLLTY